MNHFMTPLSTGMLLVLIFCSGITVLAMMRVLATVIEHETDLHDLRNRIQQLQYERQLYYARMRGQIAPEETPEPIEAVEKASQAAERVRQAAEEQPVRAAAA